MRSTLGNEQDGPEGNLSLGREMGVGHGVVIVLAEALVERVVVGIIYLLRGTQPDGLVVVHRFPVVDGLVDYLHLKGRGSVREMNGIYGY